MKKISFLLFVFFFEQQQFLISFYILIGDSFDTQLSDGGSGENSRLTNYTAFMLGIVQPDSYSQSLANNYEWQSKVLNFHQHEVAYFLPSQHVQGGPLKKILQQEKVLNMLIPIGIRLCILFFAAEEVMIIYLIFIYLNGNKDANDHNSTQDRTDTYSDSSDGLESSHHNYINYTLCCTSKSSETEPPKGK